MERSRILKLMHEVMARQGKSTVLSETMILQDIGFRSLDFSELALLVEQEAGRELNFDAGKLRGIESVGDVLDFLVEAAAG